jgi:hypothetical protein
MADQVSREDARRIRVRDPASPTALRPKPREFRRRFSIRRLLLRSGSWWKSGRCGWECRWEGPAQDRASALCSPRAPSAPFVRALGFCGRLSRRRHGLTSPLVLRFRADLSAGRRESGIGTFLDAAHFFAFSAASRASRSALRRLWFSWNPGSA